MASSKCGYPSFRIVEAEEGDTLTSIAEREDFSGSLTELLTLNAHIPCPNQSLAAGDQVLFPLEGISKCGPYGPQRTVQAAEGDTLASIAEANGLFDYINILLCLNPEVSDPDEPLAEGQEVYLLPDPQQKLDDSNKILQCYVGARPGGLLPPDLSQVPRVEGVQIYYALAFARDFDHDGMFTFYDGMSLTPDQVAEAKAADPDCHFLVSLAGAGHEWKPPADVATWTENAISSLSALMDEYNLDGVDVDFEEVEGGEWTPDIRAGFVEAMSGLFTALKEQRDAIITLAPYGFTQEAYSELYNACPDCIDWSNFQLYSHNDVTTADGALEIVDGIVDYYGGWEKVVVGLMTNQSTPQGCTDIDEVVALVQAAVNDRGAKGAMVWTLEDSAAAEPAFEVEAQVQEVLVGAAAV